jgi:CheY-like chemotaxis protein
MTDEVRKHCFDSFFTTKIEGKGTGLGLTTTLGIIRDHKGSISVYSTPGHGSTFEIYLPATPDSEQDTTSVTLARKTTQNGRGQTILLVDDEPRICESTRRALEPNNYSVLTAHDGIEALTLFAKSPESIHLVVTDFMMPLMDGLTLCRTLQALSRKPVPIIVSSGGLVGQQGSIARQAFLDLGVHAVLDKPYPLSMLLQSIHSALNPAATTNQQPHISTPFNLTSLEA